MPAPLTAAVVLFVALGAVALAGPRALRAAKLRLATAPRAAAIAVLAAGLAFTAALVGAAPMLTWSVSGPDLVPGPAGQVCQQCLVAANPFSSVQPIPAGVPSAVLVGASALIIAAIAVSVLREFLAQRRVCRALPPRWRQHAEGSFTLDGVRVRVVEDSRPYAFSLPLRCGGVTVSRGALDVLDDAEVRAVLAHETAHVERGHHRLAALTVGVTAPLRWIPFVAAVRATVLELLEIDADAQALRRVGTTALVSALVTLQTAAAAHTEDIRGPVAASGALFVLGGTRESGQSSGRSARIASLLGAEGARRVWPTAGLAALVAPVSVMGVAVHVAGGVALLSGCAII
jgi:Zn-dependent protease with chaperone function